MAVQIKELKDKEYLTNRELQVYIKFVLDNLSGKQVADVLYISERTVKAHLSSIYRKLGYQVIGN